MYKISVLKAIEAYLHYTCDSIHNRPLCLARICYGCRTSAEDSDIGRCLRRPQNSRGLILSSSLFCDRHTADLDFLETGKLRRRYGGRRNSMASVRRPQK